MDSRMATKNDINMILDRINMYSKKEHDNEIEQKVQALHLKELRDRVNGHEMRLVKIEAAH